MRQIDGSSPLSAQRFSPEAFVAWVAKQMELADVVHCCYEAGPFGFVLHRQLASLGVKSIVVRPRNWDEYGQKVKTDRRDALALVSCLDRYVAGNTRALTSIRVPTEAEERSRSVSRHRTQLLEHRKRLAAQGLSLARDYGHDLPEEWWRAKRFELMRRELPEFLFALLEGMQRLALAAHEQLKTLGEGIESAQTQKFSVGERCFLWDSEKTMEVVGQDGVGENGDATVVGDLPELMAEDLLGRIVEQALAVHGA